MLKRNPVKLLMCIICLFAFIISVIVSYKSITGSDYNVVDNTKDRFSESKTEVNFKGRYKPEFTEEIEYNDVWFTKNSSIYNHKLALSSLYIALSTFSSGDYDKYWGEEIENIRENNIKTVFKALSFDNIEFNGYSRSLNSSDSKSAFGIAKKTFYVDDKPNNVVCIAIRSGGYGCEWSDNFNVGDDSTDFHKGFYDSALVVKKYLEDYVIRNCRKSDVKFWVCGYSRGGAIANVLASIMGNKENVYAYTFATPNTICFGEGDYDDNENIFNIINPYDPVINLPPDKWGFSKMGHNMYFPTNYERNSNLISEVFENYFLLTGVDSEIYSRSPISDLMDYIVTFAETREIYNDRYQDVFRFLAEATMTRTKVMGEWKKIGFETYIKRIFGEDGKTAIMNYENSEYYKSMNSVGLTIPELIRRLDIALRLYGHNSPEKLLFENVTLDSVNNISKFQDNKLFKDLAVGHYPEVYISWMKSIDEKDFVVK